MTVVLSTVFIIPNLQLLLLSCSRLDMDGITAVLSNRVCILIDRKLNNNDLGKICWMRSEGLHTINIVLPNYKCRTQLYSICNDGSLPSEIAIRSWIVYGVGGCVMPIEWQYIIWLWVHPKLWMQKYLWENVVAKLASKLNQQRNLSVGILWKTFRRWQYTQMYVVRSEKEHTVGSICSWCSQSCPSTTPMSNFSRDEMRYLCISVTPLMDRARRWFESENGTYR